MVRPDTGCGVEEPVALMVVMVRIEPVASRSVFCAVTSGLVMLIGDPFGGSMTSRNTLLFTSVNAATPSVTLLPGSTVIGGADRSVCVLLVIRLWIGNAGF